MVNEEKSITSRKSEKKERERQRTVTKGVLVRFGWMKILGSIQVNKKGWKMNVNHCLEDGGADDDCACSRA